ncbi:unnamed protein product [Polarella glacialis]|uniref:Uncharacterized protein n=1 Tax=Polarella glacialis TaxID=89957 RepID=A0A813EBI3_POLGL|nr:unnamed protein product [Polarella glacialis]CAE8622417.1 unnamed protein product [Polarella glacialis]
MAAAVDFRVGTAAGLYSPHPMLSNTNARIDLRTHPKIDIRGVRKLREESNFTLPKAVSETCRSPAGSPAAIEFTSTGTLSDKQRKHARSSSAPIDKYKFGAVTSHDFGWHADSPTSRARGLPRHPVHGMTQSESTRYVHNMKATLSEASMRLIL